MGTVKRRFAMPFGPRSGLRPVADVSSPTSQGGSVLSRAKTALIILAATGALVGCGVRGALERPSASVDGPAPTTTADADSGQGKKPATRPSPTRASSSTGCWSRCALARDAKTTDSYSAYGSSPKLRHGREGGHPSTLNVFCCGDNFYSCSSDFGRRVSSKIGLLGWPPSRP